MFLVSLLFSLALSASDPIIWQELDLVYSDVSGGLQLALEADVFERLDVNGDNQLSEEEWRLFRESAAVNTFKDVTEADMLEMKQNLVYPVLEVTEDMDVSQVENICGIVWQLEEMDLVEEFERSFGNNPELLLEAALEIARTAPVTVPERNFLKFDAYLEEAAPSFRFTKELHIPEECKQMSASTRRRAFSAVVNAVEDAGRAIVTTVVATGTTVSHATSTCLTGDGHGCHSSGTVFVDNWTKYWSIFGGRRRTFGYSIYNYIHAAASRFRNRVGDQVREEQMRRQ